MPRKATIAQVEAYRLGDCVTTDWYSGEERLVRRITMIEKSDKFGSGYGICADQGEFIHWRRPSFGRPVGPIDARWFIPSVADPSQ